MVWGWGRERSSSSTWEWPTVLFAANAVAGIGLVRVSCDVQTSQPCLADAKADGFTALKPFFSEHTRCTEISTESGSKGKWRARYAW